MATCVGARGAAGRAQPLVAPSTAAARGVCGASTAAVRGVGVVGRGRIAVRTRGRRLVAGPRAALATQSQTTATSASSKEFAFDEDKEVLDMDMGLCTVAIKYTPELIRSKVLSSPLSTLKLLARGWEVTSQLGVYAAGLALDQAFETDGPERVKLRASQLREMLSRLGPSFIKAGQVLANRPDVLRADYMTELCILQDNVPAFPNQQAFDIMEANMGRSTSDVFSTISAEPVAAASLGQVYRATLRATGEEVAVKVQRPGIEPIIYQDLVLFRFLAGWLNGYALKNLGTSAQLVLDEFGQKLLEELDYKMEMRNIQDFYSNYKDDPYVKIPKVYPEYCGEQLLVMEWIDGVRCTDPEGIVAAGVDVAEFIRVGVISGLRQLLEFGLFHGDPHPGNIFAMQDGRIAYVDFGNVAQLSNRNKQILVDAVVHAVNEDYRGMADDFINLGFLSPGTDVNPIVPALEQIWTDCRGQSLATFNFRTVTDKFNKLVYRYPIRIPERYALVIRSLLTQEGICMTLEPDFKFLEVAFPYIAKRLLTDEDPILRERLLQVLFKDDTFQWARLENLITLAADVPSGANSSLDLSETVVDGAKVFFSDEYIRNALILALTQDDRLHVEEVIRLGQLLRGSVEPQAVVENALQQGPRFVRSMLQTWSDNVIADGPQRRLI